MKYNFAIVSVLLCLVTSRLVLKSELEQINERNEQLTNPLLTNPEIIPPMGQSSAKPVQGIENATSGYLSVNASTNSMLFYVFYQSRGLQPNQNPSEVPIVIWLQGGPGGSSLLGNFFEMGPYNLAENGEGIYEEVKRQLSWNDHYHLLFVDNPRGVGYSIASNNEYVTDEDEVASDFVTALTNFYQLTPFQNFKSTPLYIFGESYAGHYIPSIAKGILQYNAEKPALPIPLSGVGIGDGWTDPINQLANNDLFSFALGMVDYLGKAKVEFYQTSGVASINNENWEAALSDFDNLINVITTEGGGLNYYNYRDFGSYDDEYIATFMNYEDTCLRYNVEPSVCGNFEVINTNVYNALSNDFMQSVADRVSYVVEQIPVLLYNGQYDIIVNYAAAQNWITLLNWNGQIGYYNAEFTPWILANGTDAGWTKSYQNLHFTLVNKAGHLAPYDQIESSVEMLVNFIENQTNKY